MNLLCLSDEILLIILNKLSNTDVLYSLIEVNKRLDRLVRHCSLSKSIDLVNVLTRERKFPRKIERFCFEIIPRIKENIQSLILDDLSIEQVLSLGYYPNLSQLTLINIPIEFISYIFLEESAFVNKYKCQISLLEITIATDMKCSQTENDSQDIFILIVNSFPCLKYLRYDFKGILAQSPYQIIHVPVPHFISSPKLCCSSTITHLNVQLAYFDDCLYLLAGRFANLQSVVTRIGYVDNSTTFATNKEILSNLKCFSMTIFSSTYGYDDVIVPFLRQMSQLKKLTLSFTIEYRTSFIDGTELYNNVLIKMKNLELFVFDIVVASTDTSIDNPQSCVAIQGTFNEMGYNVNCYLNDTTSAKIGRCHVYSLPFNFEYMQPIDNNFLGSRFVTVRILTIQDYYRSFEHEFFLGISQSFPFLTSLEIVNQRKQKKIHTNLIAEYGEKTLIIVFPHLAAIRFRMSSKDYLEQLLHDKKTYLPALRQLDVPYEHLQIITNNFTHHSTHRNCAKLEYIRMVSAPVVFPKDFYHYFPSLNKKLLC